MLKVLVSCFLSVSLFAFEGFRVCHLTRMRSYGADGQLEALHQKVQEKGFKVGDHILRKADEAYARITGFDKDFVLLSMESDGILGDFRVHCDSFLKKDWRKYQPRKAEECIENHSLHGPLEHDEFKILFLKGKIAQALQEVAKKHPDPDGLQLVLRPSKAVVATKGFAVGKLVLAPCTPRVAASTDAEGPGLDLGALCRNFKGEKVHFFLQSFVAVPRALEDGAVTQGCLCPCFFVPVTHDEEEANMSFVVKKEPSDLQALENVQIRVPVMRNTKPIAVGDRLWVYREKKDRPAENLDEILPVGKPAAKRRRVKGAEE